MATLQQTQTAFDAALAAHRRRALLPTALRSRLMEKLPVQVKDLSFWSAGVTKLRWVQEAHSLVDQMLQGAVSRPEARLKLRRLGVQLGARYDASPDDPTGALTRITSDARINLVLDTNVELARGAGYHAQRQDEDTLDAYPAQELIRVRDSLVKRDWPAIWQRHGGKLSKGKRMIALVNDPIWVAISRFGHPYAPFDYNSGMDTIAISRSEAIAEGVMPEDAPSPEPEQTDMAEGLEAQTRITPGSPLAEVIQKHFKGHASVGDDGVLRWHRGGAAQ